MRRIYGFADVIFEINLPDEFIIPKNMSRFEMKNDIEANYTADHIYNMRIADEPDQCLKALNERWKDTSAYVREDMIVLTKNQLECRLLSFKGDNQPYAICEEISENETDICVMRKYIEMLRYDTIFASMFSFERLLIKHNIMILHCAYMEWNGQAVLFSAPSGTGKSTQADLWEKYEGTRTINGDDALICKRDGKWFANGFSVCGSSEICHNESYPIRSVVMLYQAKENVCRRLKPMEAFRKLYPQLKINSWNQEAQERALGLLDELLSDVLILELGCDISQNAVDTLKDALMA